MNELKLSVAERPNTSVYEDFEERWIRVYTMRDGRKVEAPALYAMYEQAFEDLQLFCPVPGERILDDVSYAVIERRFYPRKSAT